MTSVISGYRLRRDAPLGREPLRKQEREREEGRALHAGPARILES